MPEPRDRRAFRRRVRELRRDWEDRHGTGEAYAHVIAWAREAGHDPAWAHEDFHLDDKDEVFAAARHEGRKIDADGVVAASRLYTPRHIVDFLLQNTLASMWLAMHPADRTPDEWPLLVRDAAPTQRPARPLRDLRILDPCCGCGAFLLAAYDLLADLYARERDLAGRGLVPDGWAVAEADVPRVIVERNLWGADLDAAAVAILTGALRDRAGAEVAPNLLVPEPPLGSLDRERVWPGAEFDVVVTNPPYVGFRQLAPEVKAAVTAADPRARSDLALAFQSRCVDLLAEGGRCGTVTPAAWLTGREGLPLRDRILERGGPRVTAALGQRVFEEAPLLFVGLSVVERGPAVERFRVLRPEVGSGPEGLRAAAAGGGDAVDAADIRRLSLRSFLPAAPRAVLRLAGRGPRLGDLFTSFDGVWTGDSARDVRYWWELPPEAEGWRALSGGQGHEPWSGPIRRRIHESHVAGQPPRAGMIEYARVAGGRLSARLVQNGAASQAGIVTLVPRDDEASERIEEVLAIFNSRIGTAWLRTLTSGLNFNPGYAAEIPLGRTPPPDELRTTVRRLVELKDELTRRDPTADTFVDTRPPWQPCELTPRIAELEAELDTRLARHLGIDPREYARLPPVPRSRPRGNDLDDHLMVRALRLLGFRWPGEVADAPRVALPIEELAARLVLVLADEGSPDRGLTPETWARHLLAPYQRTRFLCRPALGMVRGSVGILSEG